MLHAWITPFGLEKSCLCLTRSPHQTGPFHSEPGSVSFSSLGSVSHLGQMHWLFREQAGSPILSKSQLSIMPPLPPDTLECGEPPYKSPSPSLQPLESLYTRSRSIKPATQNPSGSQPSALPPSKPIAGKMQQPRFPPRSSFLLKRINPSNSFSIPRLHPDPQSP